MNILNKWLRPRKNVLTFKVTTMTSKRYYKYNISLNEDTISYVTIIGYPSVRSIDGNMFISLHGWKK